jgi:two-component system response regulator YesN
MIQQFQKSDTTLSATISSNVSDIQQLSSAYEQCQYLLKHKFIMGNGTLIKQDDIGSEVIQYDIGLNEMLQEVRFLLNTTEDEKIHEYVDQLFRHDHKNVSEGYLKNLCFSLILTVKMVLNENGFSYSEVFDDENIIWEKLLNFETIVDAKQWLDNIMTFSRKYMTSSFESKNKSLVIKIKNYIEDNYSGDLKLETIANELYYSPNYINHIFKMDTGETIYTYVAKFKVEKAKELLRETNQKLYEISATLGYTHTAYFSNLFKKTEGITPKQYRERCSR